MPRILSPFVVAHLSLALGLTAHSAMAAADEPVKQLILPGESFVVAGCPAFLLLPSEDKRTTPQPWVMYAPTLPGLPDEHEKWMHEQFLAAGIAVAGIDIGEAYGSPKGQEAYDAFYGELVTRHGFAKQCCLLGRSRGGLWNSSWAIHNPEKLSGMAGIYPVFDLSSWPGVATAAPAYEMSPEELASQLAVHNPIAHIDVLAKARVPVFLIHGDDDQVVPLQQNSAEVARQYAAAGSADILQLTIATGQGHNYWPGFFRCQELIDFVINAARKGAQPTLFSVRCNDVPNEQVAHVQPWRTIQLDPLYRGAWIVAGDLDGDGQAEIVSARNHDQDDVHYTSSVVVHRLDGSVLWRWGQAEAGRNPLHHDVAAQVYDWDGDGTNEVIVAADGAVVEIDGKTGQEKRRLAIPANASDCLVFCNLCGGQRPTDVLVKTRYTQIWAFDREGKQLWTVDMPGGQRTAHQPRPIDIDGDGRDEIVAGYAVLNSDGSVRWALDDRDPALVSGKRPVCGAPGLCPPVFTRQRRIAVDDWRSRSAVAIASRSSAAMAAFAGTFPDRISNPSTWGKCVARCPARRSWSTFPTLPTASSRSGYLTARERSWARS